jgi:hypothetical protein
MIAPMNEWDELVGRYLDGIASSEDLDRLQTLLRSDPGFARRFADAVRLDQYLCRHFAVTRSPAGEAPRLRRAVVMDRWARRIEHWWGPAIAVALHIALIGVLIRWVVWPSPRGESGVDVVMMEPTPSPTLDQPPEPMGPRTSRAGADTGQWTPATSALAPAGETSAPEMPEGIAAQPVRPERPLVPAVTIPGHWLTRHRYPEARRAWFARLGTWASEADQVAADALTRLMARQSSDGAWREDGSHPRALTSMAVLALLAHGEHPDTSAQRTAIRKGLDYLLGSDEGRGTSDLRTRALELLAVADAAAVLRRPEYWTAAKERGASVLSQALPDGGWGWSEREADPVLTAWCASALAVWHALGSGDARSRAAVARAADAMDRALQPAAGTLYYPPAEGRAYQRWARTAGAVLTLQLAGHQGVRVQRGLRALSGMPAAWPRTDGGSLEAVLLATHAYYNEGGPIWLDWIRRLAPAICHARQADGMWSTSGRSSIRDTVLAVLILEIPYRYPPAREWPLAWVIPDSPTAARMAYASYAPNPPFVCVP